MAISITAAIRIFMLQFRLYARHNIWVDPRRKRELGRVDRFARLACLG